LLQTVSFDAPASSRGTRARGWIREKIVSDRDLTKYCLKLDDDWNQAAPEKPVVVLIHGFNSSPARNLGLLAPIRAENYPCATFAYPNDYNLTYSAGLLSRELKQFKRAQPAARLALVCHSTGGLVARACIENSELDPGNVDRLIMIAPPTHGSQLARFACGTDVWEHWLTRKRGWPWTRVHDSIVDGLGEAADELSPDSAFLTQLNARPRNPRVRYSILLGDDACMTDAEVAWIRENICERLLNAPGIDGHAERLDAILADVDELIDGKGDGVVSIKRGRLEGVDDTIVMRFSHMAIGAKADRDELSAVYQAVLDRLQ
jgi:pimeloyl-ACP methyl ester carboxylesterase